jgi:hypothetical protein
VKYMRLGTVIVALVAATSCGPVPPERSSQEDVVNGLRYIRDNKPRPPLCYAVVESRGYSGFDSFSIANVPCEPLEKAGLLR